MQPSTRPRTSDASSAADLLYLICFLRSLAFLGMDFSYFDVKSDFHVL